MHDRVAFSDRVVARCCISHVRRTAGRGRYQSVAGQQFAARYGHFRVRQSIAVVGLAVARRSDRDRHFGLRHRQLSVHRSDAVVTGCARGELVALNHIRYRALARERDAAAYNCADRVVAH